MARVLRIFIVLLALSDGGWPEAGLILSGNTLYGTAGDGGSSDNGTVFAVNTDGTGFTNLHSFSAWFQKPTVTELGQMAGLILSGNTLYGTTEYGGSSGDGTVFSLSSESFRAPLAVITTSLPNGMGGEAYNQTLVAYGGHPPYGWTNSSGALPPGLNLSTNGVISGTPTNNGTFNFTVQVTDALSTMATQALTIIITLDVTPPMLTITSPTSGQRWSNVVFTVTGTATDNVAVASVFYSLNSTGWSNAVTGNGWTNWTAVVTLIPWTNTIAAYAVDTSGNVSATNTVSLVYVPSAILTVSTMVWVS